ncbi:hypothetical protein LCGC14_0514950 [marine sediment metagenome]|uniref:Uncharacterized protein n=1 Tax=marine sediment metagenome TaxID=412755 RepID=A0A0F9S4W4_9ZZZZ
MNKELINAVLDWWEKHQYDCTGEYDEYNVYDEEPEMVKIAKKLNNE